MTNSVTIRLMEKKDDNVVRDLTYKGIFVRSTRNFYKEVFFSMGSVLWITLLAVFLNVIFNIYHLVAVVLGTLLYALLLGAGVYKVFFEELQGQEDYLNGMWEYWDEIHLSGKGVFFVAECKDKVIGTVAAIEMDTNIYEIKRVKVSEEFCGQGIAQQLLKQVMEYCRDKGCTELKLFTYCFQREAISLFKTVGFKIVRERNVRLLLNDHPCYYFTYEFQE